MNKLFLLLFIVGVCLGNSDLDTSIDKTKTSYESGKLNANLSKLSQQFTENKAVGTDADFVTHKSKVWTADQQDGTFINPILHADYSDPDVVRVGSDYYMTSSSFTCIPGLPVLHSKDMVNWTLISHAVTRYPVEEFNNPQHGKGIWAPSIRYHNNMFYIYWGDPDNGIYMVKASKAEGPWEKPVCVLKGKGLIDPCPLWDDDGKAYLVHAWAASRCGVKGLLTVHRMNSEGTVVDREGKHVFDGNDNHPTVEGPKFYKANGYYYIFAPAGGVKTGWQLALRSKNVFGPYQHKIVLEQGSTDINGPHQGAWVQTPTGQSWFIHFQDKGAYGRIVHLQPVEWIDNWPMMGACNEATGKWEPVSSFTKPQCAAASEIAAPAESDEFNGDRLGLQWQWYSNPEITWYAMLPNTTYLRLFAQKLPSEDATLWDAGSLLVQKFPAPSFTATTKLNFASIEEGTQTGLVVMGKDYSYLSITPQDDGAYSLSQIMCRKADKGNPEETVRQAKISQDTLYLRVNVSAPDAACQFSYSLDGSNFVEFGKSFNARTGAWIGAKVGIFCTRPINVRNGGYADFDWFRIE